MKRIQTVMLLVFTLLLPAGCGDNQAQKAQADEPVDYFPEWTAKEEGQYLRSSDEGASSILTKMHEPTLFAATTDSPPHAYRFLWIGSFHPALALRVEINSAGSGTLTVKRLGRPPARDELGELIRDEEIAMSAAEVSAFLDALTEIDFWQVPRIDSDPMNHLVLDGATWILEGTDHGHYHVVERNVPQPTIAAACLLLAEKAEIDELY